MPGAAQRFGDMFESQMFIEANGFGQKRRRFKITLLKPLLTGVLKRHQCQLFRQPLTAYARQEIHLLQLANFRLATA